MEWHWDYSWVDPWQGFMGSSCASHPIGLPWNGIGMSHWVSMERFCGQLMGIPKGVLCVAHGIPTQGAFHGMALGLFLVPWKGSMGSSCAPHPMGLPWNGIVISHWGAHGKVLWVAHGDL